MKLLKIALLAVVAAFTWIAFVTGDHQASGQRGGSRKLLVNTFGGMILYEYPPPPPSAEYLAATGRQQRLRDLLYGSLTPPGMQPLIPSEADGMNVNQEGAPERDPTLEAPAPESTAEEEEDSEAQVKDGGPFLVLGVAFVLILGVGAGVFAVYKMKEMKLLGGAMFSSKGGEKTVVGEKSRGDVLKAKMAKLRESINSTA
eukprot:CAMPEP_0198208156 /NCGR_PEP_ID=MMETSP1445-20131203/11545_1 /TAXON_ID=36898 /ORGANISM="Pyramimonas sp., Strain CCMP2087" /LENGTH=200 /DNA_ID=CAMNT_0043881445 /DNA_START=95 /DNA_END=697 /DNA_ORIENTATION=-